MPGMLVDIRTLAGAALAAAAIAGTFTWVESTLLRTARAPAPVAAAPAPVAPPATSVIAKTRDEVDRLAGLREDPTLRLETASAWRPAGGLSILMSPSWAPNARIAALPMPPPVVAQPDAPQADLPQTAEVEDVPLPRANPAAVAALPVRPKNGAPAAVATAPEASRESKPSSGGLFGFFRRLFAPQDQRNPSAVLAANPRTAIYDISAHTVYLPSGEALEAHSGLGQWLDDPSSFNRKDRGVTPPNTYRITLREKPFHGVQALRLTPVDETSMYGRDGMLAHSYMLGPNGQSNGCVSFKDYDRFLQAYSNGEVEQLIVVPRLTASAFAQAS